jgi:hypothetical protein
LLFFFFFFFLYFFFFLIRDKARLVVFLSFGGDCNGLWAAVVLLSFGRLLLLASFLPGLHSGGVVLEDLEMWFCAAGVWEVAPSLCLSILHSEMLQQFKGL